MLKFLTFGLILVIFIAGRESVLLLCKYGESYSDGHFCIVQNCELITSKDDRGISEVQGQFEFGKDYDNVKWFLSESKRSIYFPRDLTKFFKNIEIVWITDGNLKEISKEDLKQFGEKLKFLDLANNHLEVIEGDLFEFNKNLEAIYLRHNRIRHIESKTFNGLQNLHSLYLEFNPCTSENAYAIHYQPRLLHLIRVLKVKCKDPNYSTTSQPSTIVETILAEHFNKN